MPALRSHYRQLLTDSWYRRTLLLSIFAVVATGVVNVFTVAFTTSHASDSVTDLILSNTPVFDVDQVFVYATVLLIASLCVLALVRPNRLPFILYSLALFWLIRSGFTTLTHIAPFPEHTAIDFGTAITKAFFGADLFFSGHTGTPFLIALMFWNNNKFLRNLYLAVSVFFAVIVLMGHIHYSIDVASAFFITYGIYHLALWLFPREHALFLEESK